jgi:hypothetical protein
MLVLLPPGRGLRRRERRFGTASVICRIAAISEVGAGQPLGRAAEVRPRDLLVAVGPVVLAVAAGGHGAQVLAGGDRRVGQVRGRRLAAESRHRRGDRGHRVGTVRRAEHLSEDPPQGLGLILARHQGRKCAAEEVARSLRARQRDRGGEPLGAAWPDRQAGPAQGSAEQCRDAGQITPITDGNKVAATSGLPP